jgi:hypothetical protein
VLLQGLAQAACCVCQNIEACDDDLEVVVAQQLQDKGNKLGQLLSQDCGLIISQVCEAALDLLDGSRPCLLRWKRRVCGVAAV